MSDSLAARGLLDSEAAAEAEALTASLAGSDLETVRVVFPDPHGVLRGKTVVAGALPSVFEQGLAAPSTLLLKDTSHRTVFPVWSPGQAGPMQGANDILLVPDPSSFVRLPWAPHSAWLFAEPRHRDGAPIPFSCQQVLARAQAALAEKGLHATFGLEVEFQVFTVTDPALEHADTTMPGRPPQTRALAQGYQYLTETRYDAVEPVLDLIRRNAQGLGLAVRSVEVEMGPSQFEITFDPADAATQARAFAMFRTMAREVCAREGLLATFMPKPRVANGAASGWHIHQSVADAAGRNLFMPEGDALTDTASAWIAGLLDHATESSLLIAPTVNSYKRYAPYQLAPNRILWGRDNRGAMLRGLMAPDDPASRVENRAADTAANPWYALAAQMVAGLAGIEAGRTAPPPTDDPYGDAPPLPADLGAAIEAFEGSALFRRALGGEFVDYLATLKRAEWRRYLDAVSEWEQAEYFTLF